MPSTFPPHPVPPPFPFPAPDATPRAPLVPPTVYVTPAWEYRHLSRDMSTDGPLTEDELNALGAEGWELTATLPAGTVIHFYFKRARE